MNTLTAPDWVETRPYQQKAVRNWFAGECRGILRMATGTGKTITALLAAARVTEAVEQPLTLVVSVPYQHLVDQWASELTDFGVDPVLAYESRRNWQPRLERQLLETTTGSRETCVVVTTHRTLSGEPARRTLERATGAEMLIADEVHHLGAKQSQKALRESFDLRIGLSATPERWYDDEGTAVLANYFGETAFEYGLEEAIEAGALCEYYYIPHVVELDDEEMEVYLRLSAKIGRLAGRVDGELDVSGGSNQALQQALFKRARLVGTAAAKLDLLESLFRQEPDLSHTLVYCSDGATGPDAEGDRHVDATTGRLRDSFDVSVRQFTAREDQSERETLLSQFDDGDIEVLTSIRCLDEGVDVPATRRAYILASTANPRQYVQRRGRILRTHPGKEFAVIHDFVTVPDIDRNPEVLSAEAYETERTLVRKELQRVATFARAARNHPDADVDGVPTTDSTLQEVRRKYELLTT